MLWTALITRVSAQTAKLNIHKFLTQHTQLSFLWQGSQQLCWHTVEKIEKIPPNHSFFCIATYSVDSVHSLQWGSVVSVTAFIKCDFFANAKACPRRLKTCFLEAAVQKILITPTLMENKVNSFRKNQIYSHWNFPLIFWCYLLSNRSDLAFHR